MINISLFFFEENVLITKFDTSWKEASKFLIEYIINHIIESESDCDKATLSSVCDSELFCSLKEQILLFKDCSDPDIVCDVFKAILEGLDVCTFDRKVTVGDNYLLRGLLEDKNFLIEVSLKEV